MGGSMEKLTGTFVISLKGITAAIITVASSLSLFSFDLS